MIDKTNNNKTKKGENLAIAMFTVSKKIEEIIETL